MIAKQNILFELTHTHKNRLKEIDNVLESIYRKIMTKLQKDLAKHRGWTIHSVTLYQHFNVNL